MSDDTTTGDGAKCDAKTADGDDCQNPATEGNLCWIHAGESDTEKPGDGVAVPSREAFAELGAFVVEATGFNPKDGDGVDTQAAKAYLKEKDAGTEGYREAFGVCGREGCKYGANGYESDFCRKHEGTGDTDTDGDTDGDTPQTKADFVKALMEDGLSAMEAAEKATEVWD